MNYDNLPIWPKPEKPILEIDSSGNSDVSKELQLYALGLVSLVNSDGTPFMSVGTYLIKKAIAVPSGVVLSGGRS